MKPKSFSEGVLCGFKKVDGRQFFGDYCAKRDNPEKPRAVCVWGAYLLCAHGSAAYDGPLMDDPACNTNYQFINAWGATPYELNDEGMPWEHIYGMARAAGL